MTLTTTPLVQAPSFCSPLPDFLSIINLPGASILLEEACDLNQRRSEASRARRLFSMADELRVLRFGLTANPVTRTKLAQQLIDRGHGCAVQTSILNAVARQPQINEKKPRQTNTVIHDLRVDQLVALGHPIYYNLVDNVQNNTSLTREQKLVAVRALLVIAAQHAQKLIKDRKEGRALQHFLLDGVRVFSSFHLRFFEPDSAIYKSLQTYVESGTADNPKNPTIEDEFHLYLDFAAQQLLAISAQYPKMLLRYTEDRAFPLDTIQTIVLYKAISLQSTPEARDFLISRYRRNTDDPVQHYINKLALQAQEKKTRMLQNN